MPRHNRQYAAMYRDNRSAHLRGVAVVALVTVLTLSFGAVLSVGASANDQQGLTSTWASAVSVTGKTVLPQTSFGSPAFASRAGRSVLAWAGTDAAHHLNILRFEGF